MKNKTVNPYSGIKGDKRIVIAFMGDVMLGRLVDKMITETDYSYPWGNVLSILQKNDLNIINLETALTNSSNAVPKVFNFKASPDRIKTLIAANIGVVNIANNHILDFGREGMLETIETLDKHKILHVGAGKKDSIARKPVVVAKNGLSIGILGYTDNEPDWSAKEDTPGTNYIKVGDIDRVRRDIAKIRDKADILIISFHWGPNMTQKPSKQTIDFAHEIIENGADIIHGHSAHIFQGIELYGNGLIMYDTGDFIDDYTVDWLLRNDRSFLFCVEIGGKNIKAVKLIPVVIDNMQVNLAKENDYAWLINEMKRRSAGFGVNLREEQGNLLIENG